MGEKEATHILEKRGGTELIANTMAQRMLAQVKSGKPQQSLLAEKKNMQEALKLAQKAYYLKDPKSVALLQLDVDEGQGSSEQILIEDGSASASGDKLTVDEDQFVSVSPEENEELIMSMDE